MRLRSFLNTLVEKKYSIFGKPWNIIEIRGGGGCIKMRIRNLFNPVVERGCKVNKKYDERLIVKRN